MSAALVRTLLALLALVSAGMASAQGARPADQDDDLELYRHIVERVRAGDNYYRAAATEQRRHGYPVRPALAMRPPTLAVVQALLPGTPMRAGLLWAVIFAVLVAWRNAFADRSRWETLAQVTLIAAGLFGAFFVRSAYLHEMWSSVLVLAALTAQRRPWAMVALALAAVLVRETALAYLGAILLVALWLRDWRKAGLAGGAIIVAMALWLLHARAVAAVGLPGDLASPGWLGFNGIGMIDAALQRNLVLYGLPGRAMLPIALVSLAAMLRWGGEAERVAALGSGGFLVALTVLGRPDNAYWGFMIAPFVLLGLPVAGRRLMAAAAGRRTT